jgi:hypothetical protein
MKDEVSLLAVVAAACLCATSAVAQSAPSPGPDAWEQLRFLIGTWDAKTLGGSAGAASSGTYSFQLELRDHILARHSSGAGCKGPASFDCQHGDRLYVYQDAPGQPYKAIYFDNEGHVIHYDVSIPGPASVLFLSGSSQPGPQFRLSYELKGSTMFGKFQMRAPGRTEFTSYLEWSGAKR